jgi:flagellar biosynthesis protein FlhG
MGLMVTSKEISSSKEPFVLSIGGGKGGVGKSMVSSNLAVQYARAGMKVVLFDLDFGAANLHTIFGIRHPEKGLGEFFMTPRSKLKDYIVETSVENLSLAPSCGFVSGLANLKYAHKIKLINQIRTLDADLVLLDLGAGSSYNVIDFFSMTQAGIVVTSPEPTSVVNAYEFLKNVIYRVLFRMFRNYDEVTDALKHFSAPSSEETAFTVEDLIAEIAKKNQWAADNVREVCKDFDVYVIFNQARKYNDVYLIERLREISKKYLSLDINFGGMVFYNEEVSTSVFKMKPISILEPSSITVHSIKNIASYIMSHVIHKMTTGERLKNFNQQLSWVTSNARSDFEANLLLQKRMQREMIRQALPQGSNVSLQDSAM